MTLPVAYDVTPLAGFRTGIGRTIGALWTSLTADPGLDMHPYALGVAGARLPAGARRARVPTRLLLGAWSRSAFPPIDRWLGPCAVVHATNFVIGPTRRPVLLTLHDIGFALDPASADAVTSTFPAIIARAIARGAHLHVTTAHGAAEVDAHFGPGLGRSGRISVVPFGITPLPHTSTLPAPLAARVAGRPYALAVGAHMARKRLPLLVTAFGLAAPDLSDLCLVIAGPEGPDTQALHSAHAGLEPALRERVIITGALPDGPLAALLRGATLLAYPSAYEGFGLPPLEAMSVGVPAVVSAGGAVAEVAGPGAYVVDRGDPEAWAEGLRSVATDESLRADLVRRGTDRAAAFSWKATAQAIGALYRRLAEAPTTSA